MITYIKRIVGATNNLVYLETTDDTAVATAANYITVQTPNITSINDGLWTWEANDCIMLSASDGISWCSINSTFTTLAVFSAVAGVAGVTLSGASVIGDFPVFSSVAGAVVDSAVLASNIMLKNVVNTMASGGEIIFDKSTATSTAGAATINHQGGVITTEALTTAAAAAYAFTLTNSEIASTSIVTLQLMGGTNTTRGLELRAIPGSGTCAISIYNNNVAGTALNGTLIFGFVVH